MVSLRYFAAFMLVFCVVFFPVSGQSSPNNNNREMSVEESYLQESIEIMIIREQTRADGRENKLIALEYIKDAVARGNTGEEVRNALEYLALEGSLNKARENGRLVNNFPDVRAKAAAFLGELGTVEAKDTLLRILMVESEPMVLTEAIKSLGKIGLNDHDETANVIAWIVTRFDVLNPDNLLALSALDAYETLAEKNGGIKDPAALRTMFRIAEGSYIKPVQERAKQLIFSMRKYMGSGQNSGSNSNTAAAR